jgi:hypothetical protein
MSRRLGLIACLLGVVLAAMAVLGNPSVARGWLPAFLLASMLPIGSLALLLVHGVTGGRWGRDLAPVLVPAVRAIPLLLPLALPLLIFRPLVYDWDRLDLQPDVLAHYLNPAFFDARLILALVVWSGLAWGGAWRRPLPAGLGLAAHLALSTFIPADLILTLAPGSVSAGFGMGFGIEQILAALGFAALLAPRPGDPRASQDLAGMIVTALLGTVYFVYVQFLIAWYGNIPAKVAWYAARADRGWSLLALAAFLVGAALPFLAILSPVVRRDPTRLRPVGALLLAGAALHLSWLTAPALGVETLLPAALAAVAMVSLLLAPPRTAHAG